MIASGEDRAVSVTVNYVIALALTAILISGLLIAGGSLLEDRRESVTREEFTVLGEQLAAGVGEADSLASTGAEDLRVAVRLPDSVGGSSYLVRVTETTPPADQPGEYVLTFSSPAAEVSWNVTVRTDRPVEETQVPGGSIVVVLQEDGGSMEFALVTGEEVGPN
ncbi:hypothetical protein HUG10_02585 [Halorarum halophilum]|uniref:Uncharacterized protein n=1 Tax=Halorarum halophilum TaxID=2743090 RepID=A0A7D5GXY8_9EURY|nr:hypothetical protein [Halobaculum halophilum]QLG26493.1 hypothetical protein HUG10_02585 [Halobaculum halophilum]